VPRVVVVLVVEEDAAPYLAAVLAEDIRNRNNAVPTLDDEDSKEHLQGAEDNVDCVEVDYSFESLRVAH